MPKSVPIATPSPALAAAPLAPAPASMTPPTSVLKPPAPIPPRVGSDIKNEGNMEMPQRTRGETRTMRDALQKYAHRHGVLSVFVGSALRVYARWSGWDGRFIPDAIVGVHTLSLLVSSRVAHDHATEDNYTQDKTEYTTPCTKARASQVSTRQVRQGRNSWVQYIT